MESHFIASFDHIKGLTSPCENTAVADSSLTNILSYFGVCRLLFFFSGT